jgi:hypothetical protein
MTWYNNNNMFDNEMNSNMSRYDYIFNDKDNKYLILKHNNINEFIIIDSINDKHICFNFVYDTYTINRFKLGYYITINYTHYIYHTDSLENIINKFMNEYKLDNEIISKIFKEELNLF